jgi:hypothetical protein
VGFLPPVPLSHGVFAFFAVFRTFPLIPGASTQQECDTE